MPRWDIIGVNEHTGLPITEPTEELIVEQCMYGGRQPECRTNGQLNCPRGRSYGACLIYEKLRGEDRPC